MNILGIVKMMKAMKTAGTESRFRGDIALPVNQTWNDLARWQMTEFGRVCHR
jgi:hypothetical protein